MGSRNKKLILFQRLFIWSFYIFSGFILYLKQGSIFPSLIIFTRVIYPLSIFWVQIRLKRRNNLFPIDASMTTSQLWFVILPILASILAVILATLNTLIFLYENLFNS